MRIRRRQGERQFWKESEVYSQVPFLDELMKDDILQQNMEEKMMNSFLDMFNSKCLTNIHKEMCTRQTEIRIYRRGKFCWLQSHRPIKTSGNNGIG